MAHGKNAQYQNKDWWGKRPLSGLSVRNNGMKFWKRLLHKKERLMSKKAINESSSSK